MIVKMGNKRNMLSLMSYPRLTHRLNNEGTGFQAELYGIRLAIDWIQNQCKKAPTYAINVDSKAAILAIANKHTTHPLAVEARRKTIELRKYTSVTLHWVKGHSGLKEMKGQVT